MKMEEQVPAGCIPGEASEEAIKALHIGQGTVDYKLRMEKEENPLGAMHSGSTSGSLRTTPHQVKEEPEEGLAQNWEAQWQEFLRTVESSHSSWGTPQLPEEPKPWGDPKAFLATFEQVAEACQWPKEKWVTQILPALSGEAKEAYSRLETRDREDYGKVKAAILRRDTILREKNRQHFRHFRYQEAEGPRGAYCRLQQLCCQWLTVKRHTKEQILELLILEQFLTILPQEIQCWVQEAEPETCTQAVSLVENFLLRQQETKQKENQVAFEEASASSSETGQVLFNFKQGKLCMETKQEDDNRGGSFWTAKGWVNTDERKKYTSEDSEAVEPPRDITLENGRDFPPVV
ncbi:uncharacterized protein LOC128342682 [Hemicordylus capensis]|uniref:uncharacterized protein LOC128342682 n=1 Tax=Hemicordylus capensis TaxID=884348 RepID=UPI0023046647|nr:uncharacterized protein LOC128342682 [Hemicordylus capensis]XP_053146354.1 uncharacterized protein LOC128342682 [Hemicordylus capensis]